MSSKPLYLCGIDIEKSRAEQGTGFLAVGIVLTDGEGRVLEQACFSNVASDFDESTGRFWAGFPDIVARMNANAADSPLVWGKVREFVESLERKYGPFGRQFSNERKFRWICDNPAYDIGQVNTMLHLDAQQRGLSSKPLAEIFTDYVPTSDPTEQFETLLDDEKEFVRAQLKTPHSHYPTEDALRDIEMFVAIRQVLEKRKQ